MLRGEKGRWPVGLFLMAMSCNVEEIFVETLLSNSPFAFRAGWWKKCASALVFGILCVRGAVGADSGKPIPWSLLDYEMNIPCLPGEKLAISVTPGAYDTRSLKVDLSWIDRGDGGPAFDRLKMRLHYPDGHVIEASYASGPFMVTAGVLMHLQHFVFPYGDNTLTEAWFELRADDRTYWLEVPYGFTRNPEYPPPPSDPKAEDSPFAPAMFQMRKDDDIVRWSSVQYKYGPIQNGWDLEVNIAHRGDIRCQVKLRRPDGRWAIHTPVTTVRVERDNSGPMVGEQISSYLRHPNCREDEFTFDFKPLTGRSWGNLIVTVDDKPYSRTISLGTFLEGIWVRPSSR